MPRHTVTPTEPPSIPIHAGRYVRDPGATEWTRTDDDAAPPDVPLTAATADHEPSPEPLAVPPAADPVHLPEA
jgi:hypothetical protein